MMVMIPGPANPAGRMVILNANLRETLSWQPSSDCDDHEKSDDNLFRSSGQNSAVQSVLTSNKAYVGLSDTATEVLDLFPCSLVVVCILGHCWVEGYNWMYSSHHVKPYLFCLYNGISSDMTVPIGKKIPLNFTFVNFCLLVC